MRPLHFHPRRRNVRFGLAQVDFSPFRLLEFAGTQEHQRGEPNGATDNDATPIIKNGSHQRTDCHWFCHCREMAALHSLQRASQIRRGITISPPGCDGVPENLAAGL